MYWRKSSLSAELFEQVGEMFEQGVAPLLLGITFILVAGLVARWSIDVFLTNPDVFLLGFFTGGAGLYFAITGGALLIYGLILLPIALMVGIWEWISGKLSRTRK